MPAEVMTIEAPQSVTPELHSSAEAPSLSVTGTEQKRGFLIATAHWFCSALMFVISRCWQFFCLVLLLAIAASIPILQFASLGYLLESAGRWARGDRLRQCLPVLVLPGELGRPFYGLASHAYRF